MEKKIKAKNGEDDSTIEVSHWDAAVELTQDADKIFLQDARQARKVIKAIKKAAKRLGWEV